MARARPGGIRDRPLLLAGGHEGYYSMRQRGRPGGRGSGATGLITPGEYLRSDFLVFEGGV